MVGSANTDAAILTVKRTPTLLASPLVQKTGRVSFDCCSHLTLFPATWMLRERQHAGLLTLAANVQTPRFNSVVFL